LEVNSKQVDENDKDSQDKEAKEDKVIGAPPSNWPLFECFDNIFLVLLK
jgi:hypothetical protein